MMLVPAAKQDTFEASRLVSFHKRPGGAWTISPADASAEKNYVCLLTSGALQTPGLAIKTKGAAQTLINNIASYQRHYSKFFELINSAAGGTPFGGRTSSSNATRVGSPMLLQILGHIKSLDSKTTWDVLLKQDYVEIARLGQLLRSYLMRNKVGQKALNLNFGNKRRRFKPRSIVGNEITGTSYSRDNGEWVKIYRFFPFLPNREDSIVDVQFIVATGGTYFTSANAIRKQQCTTTEAGGEMCMRIHFERSDATELCGRAIMLQNGPNAKCPRKSAEDTNMAIIPQCQKLKGSTIIVSGTAKTSTLRCAGKNEETISLSVGTTTTPGECKLDTTKGLEKKELAIPRTGKGRRSRIHQAANTCLLYTSDAADE